MRFPEPVAQPADAVDATVLVLDAIRLGGARSRSEIAERTGLGRAVVGQRITELAAAGLVAEEGTSRSTGGRPPRRLRFRAEAGYLLSADLGASSIDVARADLSGRIEAHLAAASDIAAGPEAVLGQVEAMLAELPPPEPGSDLWGVGVGVPGPVDFGAGRPVAPPIMPGWNEYPIRERLERVFAAPVSVDNDVNVMALGEWRAGDARGHANVVFVKIGTGIGAGLISDGQLHRGATGCAGDVGHIQVVEDGVVCRCGNVGCLEALAGGHALGRQGAELARQGLSPLLASLVAEGQTLTARDVAAAAGRGDPAAVELLQQSARYVGGMLATVVNLFNPSLVVVGGAVASAGDRYLATIRQTVYRRSLPLATRSLQVIPSGLGPMAGVIGAAAMVADELFSREQLTSTLARHAAPGPAPAVTRGSRRRVGAVGTGPER